MNKPDWENFISDFSDEENLAETIDHLLNAVKRLLAGKSEIRNFFKVRLAAHLPARYFGHFIDRTWRKFLLSVYVADLLSYPAQDDQVDFARLCYVLNCAPQGFTVWWAEFANGQKFPVGYTGWYCVEESLFQQVAALQEDKKNDFSHRFFLPAKQKTAYFYLFNYSIVPELKGTRLSSELIKHFVSEIQSLDYQGLFCATVSDDGRRVAEKFQMKKVGAIWSAEGVATDDLYLALAHSGCRSVGIT